MVLRAVCARVPTLGSAGALLNRMFATRTYGLMDKLPAPHSRIISAVC